MAEADMSLTRRITLAVEEHLAERGGGFLNGFIAAIDTMDETGQTVMYITAPSTQRTHISLGLATYVQLWFSDDAQRAWYATETEADD